jgi:hypothetical protein
VLENKLVTETGESVVDLEEKVVEKGDLHGRVGVLRMKLLILVFGSPGSLC